VSVLYWVLIGLASWNLLYNDSFKRVLDLGHIILFVLICLVVYSVGTLVYLRLKKRYKNITIDVNDGFERIYYESKIQYYLIALVALVIFSTVTLFNTGGLGDTSIYFFWISLFALVFVFSYRTSTFFISKEKFVWKKGFSKIECPWADVVAIHHDVEPALMNAGRQFVSTSFFVETKNGFTKYADLTNIKVKGSYTVFSQGDKLVEEIKLKSGAPEKSGDVSMFKQTQKLSDVVFLLLGILLIPILIMVVYGFFTGTNPF